MTNPADHLSDEDCKRLARIINPARWSVDHLSDEDRARFREVIVTRIHRAASFNESMDIDAFIDALWAVRPETARAVDAESIQLATVAENYKLRGAFAARSDRVVDLALARGRALLKGENE